MQRFCAETIAWFDALPLGPRIRTDYPGDTKEFIGALRHRLALLPLIREFAAAKAALPAVDFADQMTVAARVAGLAEVQAIERARYAAVLLDEYQDTGHAQVETLRGLFGAGHPVIAVGDPLQSIYGWRGASSGNMAAYCHTFRDAAGEAAVTYPLATSFRNDRAILTAANAVAVPLRTGTTAVELRPGPAAAAGEVVLARTETVEDEASWVAEQLSRAWTAVPPGNRSAAVLVRRRSQIPLLADAAQAAGLPVEIVGLGGLLTTPEVADVVATLRALIEPDAGTALARLLTGARWRIGPRDLAALGDRARTLGRELATPRATPVQTDLLTAEAPPAPVPAAATAAVPVGIIEALDDLGTPERYSPDGYRRMHALADELRRLRRRVAGPLPDLVAEVEHAISVDLEVAARADRERVGRAHLDRFLDEAADFANEADEASLPAFLAFLAAAEDEENGLEAGEVTVEPERVQILTVHGAKGLEWDIVAVPGLVQSVFPADPKAIDWTRTRQELPIPLRGDRTDLPSLALHEATDRKQVRDLVTAHNAGLRERHAREERRLAYVALTRARHVLVCSGYVWDTTQHPRVPSPFLTEVREHAVADQWYEPEPEAANPLTAQPRAAEWPLDPFGPYPGDRGPGRRAAVERGAALVRAAASHPADATSEPAQQWRADVDRLLAERARLARGTVTDVELPAQLSVSQLVELDRDPHELARALHRPVPRPPTPWARRGTAFHTWLEQRWQHQALLDVDELPGAADADADDPDSQDFDDLRAAFEKSNWAHRTPVEIEVPFEMTLRGTVLRGRMDAVFNDPDTPGGWLVVDWKTGRRPAGAAAHAAAVQLAAYRLAWARLCAVPDDQLHLVRAAFHYVRTDDTVEPTSLLDADGLRRLIEG